MRLNRKEKSMRELAPVPTPETVLPLLKTARENHQMFEYRMTDRTRKHNALDATSVNMLITVLEAVNEKNRTKLLAMAPNVGRMALIAWEAVGRTKQ
jgi:hypothetical protein